MLKTVLPIGTAPGVVTVDLDVRQGDYMLVTVRNDRVPIRKFRLYRDGHTEPES